ncbi:MAG: universal stress protein [Candidatus Nanohaloarchaea archaeon]
MYNEILVPTDGSEGSEVALEHAIEIAQKFDARVHALYIIDIRARTTGDMWASLVGQFREIGENATESIADRIKDQGLDAVREVTEGIPHKGVNNYVDENDIDLVVMGTQGRTGLDRVLVGSTTEKVIRTSEVPVMTVRKED